MALTNTFVQQVKPGGSSTGDKHSDGYGLYLHVKRSGKYWRMAYRFGGKQRTLALGVYPAVGLADARRRCREARQVLADGTDPMEVKRTEHAAEIAATSNTVQAVANNWLVTKRDGWSDTHYVREARNLRKDLLPFLGHRVIGELEPPDLLQVIRKVEARGALDVAHRVLLTARGVWQHAVATGLATRDITQDIRGALKPHFKRNLPAITEPVQLGELLRACDNYQGGPVVRAALAIAPILFQRPGNLRRMRWANLDLDAALWTIPSADMKRTKAQKINGKPHVVPLPQQVVAILRGLHPLTGHGEYVFPGFRDLRAPMSEAGVNAALHAMGYAGRQSWHGFRATGRTILREQLGFDVDVIETQLAHSGHVAHGGAYDRAQFVKERTAMLQRWADYLDKLRAGADVIPLRQA